MKQHFTYRALTPEEVNEDLRDPVTGYRSIRWWDVGGARAFACRHCLVPHVHREHATERYAPACTKPGSPYAGRGYLLRGQARGQGVIIDGELFEGTSEATLNEQLEAILGASGQREAAAEPWRHEERWKATKTSVRGSQVALGYRIEVKALSLTFDMLEKLTAFFETRNINLEYAREQGMLSDVTPGDPSSFGIFIKPEGATEP